MGFTVNHQRNMTLKRPAAKITPKNAGLNPFTAKCGQRQISTNVPHFIF